MDGVKPRLPSVTPFNSAALVRLLAGLGLADVAPTQLTLAERWSPWLAWTDAIALSAVLGSRPSAHAAVAGPDTATGARAAAAACRRLRHELSQAITTDPVLVAPAPRAVRPARVNPIPAKPLTDPDMTPMDPADFSALRRQYQTHQQSMDTRIGALREQLRSTLQAGSPTLGRLAALDAVLDGALAARQRQLLATVPGWLDRSFKRRPPTRAAAAAELQRALLAELDLRLLPVQGLAEAWLDARPAAAAGATRAQP